MANSAMSSFDIGMDLGTSNVTVCLRGKGIVLREPSAIAYHKKTDEIMGVGQKAYDMLEKTPPQIVAVQPLLGGVVGDFNLTTDMIKVFLQRVCGSSMVKPRVVICVPSVITEVEARAVIDAAMSAGARKVYLVEEPFAAALGSGIDITKPQGNMIVNVGGATTNVAVVSLKGIVTKNSVKVAGGAFDEAIIKHIRLEHALLIGQKMAEEAKIQSGCTQAYAGERTVVLKGRCLKTGLPKRLEIPAKELATVCLSVALEIVSAVQLVIEQTPPELVGDLQDNGITLCGAGAKLGGLLELISQETKLETHLTEDPEDCVALGTAKAFDFEEELEYGMVDPVTYRMDLTQEIE